GRSEPGPEQAVPGSSRAPGEPATALSSTDSVRHAPFFRNLLKGEMTTEVAKQHALDRPMSHPTGGFLSEVWHGPPSWRRKHLEGSYLGPQHRPCALSGAPDRSEAWSSAARGMIRSSASRLMSSPGIPSA